MYLSTVDFCQVNTVKLYCHIVQCWHISIECFKSYLTKKQEFSVKKLHLKILPAKRLPFCWGLISLRVHHTTLLPITFVGSCKKSNHLVNNPQGLIQHMYLPYQHPFWRYGNHKTISSTQWVFLYWKTSMCWIEPGPLCAKRTEMSYCKISWRLEATKFRFRLFQWLWNLTGTLAAELPRCLSHFRLMQLLQYPISWLWDFDLVVRRLTT